MVMSFIALFMSLSGKGVKPIPKAHGPIRSSLWFLYTLEIHGKTITFPGVGTGGPTSIALPPRGMGIGRGMGMMGQGQFINR